MAAPEGKFDFPLKSVMHSSVACCPVNVTRVWKKSEKRSVGEKFSYREITIEIAARFGYAVV
jgi:hypothetical protein